MKLVYTDIRNQLTPLLAKEAQRYANEGKRVFYIAPNSLSFEKERKVLENLTNHSSFHVIITRFAQMARYFILGKDGKTDTIDETGLTMVFYRVLSQFRDGELKLYGRLQKDHAFIQQLVDLYKELKTANMPLLDLEGVGTEKMQELKAIFSKVSEVLSDYQVETESAVAFFARFIQSGQLDTALSSTVVVVDGFTRFSAEEDYLIHLLSEKCSEVIIGTYASQKAYQSTFIYGNVYQAPVEFLRRLANAYGVKPQYLSFEQAKESSFDRLTRRWESLYDFTYEKQESTASDKALQIWSVRNQKEEVEWVARQIRQLLSEGVRYKDILVLLGDVESYKLQVETVFSKFDIPYYFGKMESMSYHPLVHFIDSLERIKRYNYRSEDVLNLLKSGLFGAFEQHTIDRFSQYIRYADIKGKEQFSKDFYINPNGKYTIDTLNTIRESLFCQLDRLFAHKVQSGHQLVLALHAFFEECQLPRNMGILAQGASEAELDRHEQVWKLFSDLLYQLDRIFAAEEMEIGEILSLLRAGMLAAEYRTIPATVDVVNVKSYELIEPHTSPYVFSLGMTKENFPKIVQNKSLLTDQERQLLNEVSSSFSTLEIAAKENGKRGLFTALCLFQSATKQLVLSYPQVGNESEEEISVYLNDLRKIGVVVENKEEHRFDPKSETIGHYKDLLSTVLSLHQLELDKELTKEEQTFWSVASRYLTKRLESEGFDFGVFTDKIQTTTVSKEALSLRFKEGEALPLSVSALTTFYTNQYLYFLRYVLGLRELESIRPDHRKHGTYLHKIFELAMKEEGPDFDQRLETAITKVSQLEEFSFFYNQDEESRFYKHVLEKISRSTASVLKDQNHIEMISQEEYFKTRIKDQIQVKGIIDRVDRLSADQSLGVVDYKSSAVHFDIQQFYNGLNSQLVTYLQTIKENYHVDIAQLFGAMYLHMQEPTLELKSVEKLEDLSLRAQAAISYKGIFIDKHKEHLTNGNYHLANSLYTEEELSLLFAHNQMLFEKAADSIRTGHFLINPYTKDGKSVLGQQEKSITHFEADRHMSYARKIASSPARNKKERFLEMMSQTEEQGE